MKWKEAFRDPNLVMLLDEQGDVVVACMNIGGCWAVTNEEGFIVEPNIKLLADAKNVGEEYVRQKEKSA
jgi:hypothetical protein